MSSCGLRTVQAGGCLLYQPINRWQSVVILSAAGSESLVSVPSQHWYPALYEAVFLFLHMVTL
jgi:hypothetical protein